MGLIECNYSANLGVLLHEYFEANVEQRTSCIRRDAGTGKINDRQS
jgi:hypothetical protein